tara:strand:- start:5507 stop:6829 length:1323 start_codon:yes stop_codon:yes gene_type:complete
MPDHIIINKKINNFKKKIFISGDKSISIRWVLFASIASGISRAKNLLVSEDVLAAIKIIKKFGIKVIQKKGLFVIFGKGINGYNYRKNIVLNAGNSATLGRLILGLIINSNTTIKLIGDRSLSKRDFKRVTSPLSKFGAKFKLQKGFSLPLTIQGSKKIKSIRYHETKGSAQCKSSVMLAAMRANGTTYIKAKKSRDHTERMMKNLSLPIKVIRKKDYDLIQIKKVKKIKKINYNIPSDISSSAFFIVLTALSNESELIIKNININPSRIGVITILKKMGVNITFQNKKIYKGEEVADIKIKSSKSIKPINCPPSLNSSAIDEFLVIFLVAAKANGNSYFKGIAELNKKESPRLKWGSKILNKMGIKNITTHNSIKIFGNPNLKINKKIIIENYLKDHRVFMTSVVAALSFGGVWKIHDSKSIKTSFPNFLKVINQLKKK